MRHQEKRTLALRIPLSANCSESSARVDKQSPPRLLTMRTRRVFYPTLQRTVVQREWNVNEFKHWLFMLLLVLTVVLLVLVAHDARAGGWDRQFYDAELKSLASGDTLKEAAVKLGREPDAVLSCAPAPGCSVAVYNDRYGNTVLLTFRHERLLTIWPAWSPSIMGRPRG